MPHVLITGAGRGIGTELANDFARGGWTVTATTRGPTPPGLLTDEVDVRHLDVAEPATFAAFAQSVVTPVDVLINNAGIFGGRPQRLDAVDPATWIEVFRVNCIGPLLLTRALLPRMAPDGARKLVTITSRMGSLGENGDGSALMYRSSKAAVNMAMQSLSFEVADQGLGILLIHPGWVRTAMGTDAATLDVAESVAGIRQVIDAFDPSEGVVFRAWDGRDLPW
ncbi:MAG: SDR family oxidoreductase [Pseudomonadota bacterium]